MLKVVSINRFEGNGIIERIEGNGWDIDADRIELNGINASIIDDPMYRIISLNGPAVEDLFKSLRDLLKENGKLRQDIEEQDECIRHLENGLKEKDAAIKALQFDKDHYKESCKILERSIEEKEDHIKALDKYLGSKNAEIDELNNKLKKYDHTQISSIIRHNNELVGKCDFLDSILPLAVKLNPILNFTKETRDNNIDFAEKTFLYFMPGYDVTVSVSRKEGTDVENNNPGKYDSTKEIIRWLDGEIKNKTDYATKIFNKESREDIFSITFCKVPVEPEVVTNEQD